jgi:hypothetical protein
VTARPVLVTVVRPAVAVRGGRAAAARGPLWLTRAPVLQGVHVTVSEAPDTTCEVAGCEEPAAVSVPAPTALALVDAPAADLVPLCSRHAGEADGREASPEPREP